jgi:hypothetical protein
MSMTLAAADLLVALLAASPTNRFFLEWSHMNENPRAKARTLGAWGSRLLVVAVCT